MGFGIATVHWVGGLGTKAGNVKSGGGVKKSVWDADPTLSSYMDANGGPKYTDTGTSYNNTTGVITATGSIFPSETDALKDWIVYVEGTNFDNDRYMITASTATTITIAAGKGQGADRTVDLYVAGAFDKLSNAIDNTDATDSGSLVTIYDSKGETLSSTVSITAGGSHTNKTYKRIVGFGSSIGDGEQITLDATSCSRGIQFADVDNVFIENVHVKKATVNNWEDNVGIQYNIILVNCRASEATQNGFYMYYSTEGCVLIGCKADNNGHTGFFVHDRKSGLLVNCFSEGNGYRGYFIRGTVAIGCIASKNVGEGDKAAFDIGPSAYSGCCYGCVAYKNGDGTSPPGFQFGGVGSIALNCIALDNLGDGFGYSANGVPYLGHCVSYNNNVNYPNTYVGLNNLEIAPHFADAENGDFRPRDALVLRGGLPDRNGNPTEIGAIIQKYQFAQRARTTNYGKLGIVR